MKKIAQLLFILGVLFGAFGIFQISFDSAQSADLQTINIGSSANDGTGDTLRSAFVKVNTNFWDLWATRVIEINGNTGTNITINATEVPATAPSLFSGTNVQEVLESVNTSLTLTPDRIVVTGPGGPITTTNDLTFNGSLLTVTADQYLTGTLGVGAATPTAKLNVAGDIRTDSQGDLRLGDADSSNYTGFQAPSTIGANIVYTLPNADGSIGQVLKTDGSGVLAWQSDTGTADGVKLVGPSLYFDGLNDYVDVADSDTLTFTDGADDLAWSVSAWVKMSDATKFYVVSKNDGSSVREYTFGCDENDKLSLFLWSDNANYAAAQSVATLTSYEGQWVHIAATYGGAGPNSATPFASAANEITLYIDGVAVSKNTISAGTYTGMTNTVRALWVGRSSSSYAKGHMGEVCMFNFDLSAGDAEDVKEGDLGFSAEWGGQRGAVFTSNFAGDANSFTASGGTLNHSTTVGGEANALRLNVDGSAGGHFLQKTGLFTKGKRYRLSGMYYVPTQSNVDGIYFVNGTSGTIQILRNASPTLNAWNTFSSDFVATATSDADRLLIYGLDGNSTSFTDAGSDDVMYVKNIVITQLGTLLDFRPEQYVDGNILGKSANDFVGVSNGPTIVGESKGLQINADGLGNTVTVFNVKDSVGNLFQVEADGEVKVANNTTIQSQGDLRLSDSDSSNYIALQSPATVSTNVTLTLPDNAGSANQVLKTDGAGVLSWASNSTVTSSTWTPSIAFGGGSTGITYDTQEGYYVYDGYQCTVHFFIDLSSAGTDTGTATITNLPYTVKNTTGGNISTGTLYKDTHGSPAFITASANTTSLVMRDGGGATIDNTDFSGADTLSGTITFMTE